MGAVDAVLIRDLGLAEYHPTWQAMQELTASRNPATADEIWLLQHPPVFTLGRNGKREHILRESEIPVIPIDRGGQVTYHGPGQLVMYVLLDLKRHELGIRRLVKLLEQLIIDFLANHGVVAERQQDAPGVYVEGRKIAALGLRVSRGCSYHGLSFNIDMDLRPFSYINPCGYANLQVTQCVELGIQTPLSEIGQSLAQQFQHQLLSSAASL